MRTLALAFSACFIASTAMAQAVDWKALGRPLDDDTKDMMDRYVYTNVDSIDRNIGLDQPVLSQTQITEWIRDNLSQIMSLNGETLDRQTVENRLRFTPNGYAQYIMYLNKSGLARFLKDNRFKTSVYVEGVPELTAQGLRDSNRPQPHADGSTVDTVPKFAYVWQAKARLVLSYLDYRNDPPAFLLKNAGPGAAANRFPLNATLELIRIPVQENDTLIAISAIRFTGAK